jgi:TusA-related sulfurtransferase
VRSRHDGICFHRVDPAYQRYIVNRVSNHYEIWTLRHALRRISRGKILRIILATEATIVSSTDNWARTSELQTTHQDELNLWFRDFPTATWTVGSVFAFTLFWKREQRWENRNWQVAVV